MSFKGSIVSSTALKLNMQVEGFLSREVASYPPNCRVTTEITVIQRTFDVNINYPTKSLCDPEMTLLELKELYCAEYGPYSDDTLFDKMSNVFAGCREADESVELLRYPERHFMRKMWLFKTFCDIVETSLGLISHRMSKIIITFYEKAISNLRYVEEKRGLYPRKRNEKYTNIVVETIERVKQKVVYIIAQDAKYIKLLSPEMLKCFVKEAAPWMVSKIKSLHWIDSEVAIMVSPSYNYYWTHFWNRIFLRNFNREKFQLSSELCGLIAEYMPVHLKGETFLEFYQRKYDDVHQVYKGKRVFIVEKTQERVFDRFIIKNKIILL